MAGTPGTTILLFGPQIVSFSKQTFEQLRSTITKEPTQHWALDTIADLPKQWKTIVEVLPTLDALPGEKLLNDLNRWFQSGVDNELKFDLPNILLTPLVVLTQLTQYVRYLELNRGERCEDDLQTHFTTQKVETLGFCTGLLSAIAVASAANQEQLKTYGAVAIRLAMLIGAVVDAQEAAQGHAKSFATAWNTPEQALEISRIIDQFPEAYISVSYDKKRATITSSDQTAPLLLQQFKATGITAAVVGLHGRFHCQQQKENIDHVLQFCDLAKDFQFPKGSELIIPSYTNANGESIKDGKMHSLVINSILVEKSNWYETFAAVQMSRLNDQGSRVISFGPDRCVPPSLIRELGNRMVQFADPDEKVPDCLASVLDPEPNNTKSAQYDQDIAVIGMAIKVAGADDLDEFWTINANGKSQHIPVPESRFGFETHWRDLDEKRTWYGNFMRDIDAFDHRFFKRSAREASSMDPQQRIMLQTAYQAVEQSGYFSMANVDKHIGCYIGACAADYEQNVACYPPNAFTATGNLKSFIPGKISHYFGWTGPGMTIDTACSASAVAIHTACRAILTGECTGGALAGGVATMENPIWFQNLAGATFLSPTGQCKPFDELADGYCRGEGIACVFLKKMSDAIADGNQIFGNIASTAVYQNQNCTPLFVPNAPSLSQLFQDVIRRANLEPEQISLVEAHGTGTPVGDPAEYESILRALAGPNRTKPLPIGSVKGLIGHTEGTSGVISLIKVLVMMQRGYIPPQASHSKLSSHIKVSSTDMIQVPSSLQRWTETYKAALINNYGASGSNASMVVTQSMHNGKESDPIHFVVKHPFWLAGQDDRSLTAYATRLLQILKSTTTTLASLSFNMCRQSNRTLPKGLLFSCSSVDELTNKLTSFSGGENIPTTAIKASRPVILCFGGQVSTFIGLERQVYESIQILRSYLDQCNNTIMSLGLDGIYPEIFQRTPVKDTVRLQTMLFAMQYSCAKAWMDSGVKIEAVVGHSFGEITALCISGVLSLKDTVQLVARRAKLVRDNWGPDSGSMMAVEGDLDVVEKLVFESNNIRYKNGHFPASIACYNGPRSFTLAGSTEAIEAIAGTIATDARFTFMKHKKLNVTNAFHSTLVQPLVEMLEECGKGLVFKEPAIHLERATGSQSTDKLTAQFVAEHMRYPVFFNQAIQRLSKKYPSAIWLEAGSSSTITIMASRALSSSKDSYFQAMNLTTDKGVQNLVDATVSLWSEGLQVTYWAHHAVQTYSYAPLILPPYQFEKSRHWLDLKKPIKAAVQDTTPTVIEDPLELWTFVSYQDNDIQRAPRFRINTTTKEYKEYVGGHLIVQTAPICPATVEVDMVIESLTSLLPDVSKEGLQPQIHNMQNHSPICEDPSRSVWIDFAAVDDSRRDWTWKIVSTGSDHKTESKHVDGQIKFRATDDLQYQMEFSRLERLVSHPRCLEILEDDDADDIIQGRNVYKTFAEIVDYGEMYRGVRKVVGKGNTCAGRVHKTQHQGKQTWLNAVLADCFSQVSGIWVNCMTDRSTADMFIATGCEQVMRSPKVKRNEVNNGPAMWDVFAYNHRESDKLYVTDLFVFSPTNGMLVDVMLGIQYAKVSKHSLSRILTRLTAPESLPTPPSSSLVTAPAAAQPNPEQPVHSKQEPVQTQEAKSEKGPSRPDIAEDVRSLIANVAGLELNEIQNDSELVDFGIDSLMGMELAREVETVFKCTLDQEELMEATNFVKFVKCIANALYGPANEDDNEDTSDDSDNHIFTDDSSEEETEDSNSSSPPNERVGQVKTTETALGQTHSQLNIDPKDIMEAFGESKLLTDQFIRNYKIDNFCNTIWAQSNRLCVALVVEAFELLGCSFKATSPGQVLQRIPFAPQHRRLVDYLYGFLENEARLINVQDSRVIIRTKIPVPNKSSQTILDQLLQKYPEWSYAHRLTYYAGKHLADILSDKTDGIRLIFGTIEGRQLVSALYCDHSFNVMSYNQIKDVISRLVSRLPMSDGPLKILEMGAGTGGTTLVLAPFLASLNVPVEYTFTDLSSSMVAQARRKFKQYPFMKFAVHDIEKAPAEELRNQHIVLASNAIHATHSLTKSGEHIRSALRPDGFLMMLEMTGIVPFIDVIFGLLEGWWLFDDGRTHAIAPVSRWEKDLQSVGFGHVDWTDGNLPENGIQKVIIAMASGEPHKRLPKPIKAEPIDGDTASREAEVAKYVAQYSAGFSVPNSSDKNQLLPLPSHRDQCVLVTGATGSLGSHLVAQLAQRPDVKTVICVNRPNRKDPVEIRQQEALSSRGISLDNAAQSKLKSFATDTSNPYLGLPKLDYDWLVRNVTHIVHNAWPMSGTRPIKAFEPQLQSLRNLIDLARDVSKQHANGFKVSFELISSIGVVGHYPLWSGRTHVPEERMEMKSVLPIGYCEAKNACERILDATLHRYPDQFRVMVARPGQIAGSKTSGYWNPIEHLCFMLKSCQSLCILPDFSGTLSWVPVNDVASTAIDLVMANNVPYPIYHIDNPVGQPWQEMIATLADALDIPPNRVVPFTEWVDRVRHSPLLPDTDNPAAMLIDFLQLDFQRMSCGGLLMDVTKTKEHSQTLAKLGPVEADVVRKYVQAWKDMGFMRK